jgi:MoxR-like ATPase
MPPTDKLYYTGDPQQPHIPDKWKQLPYTNLEKANDASLYVAPKGLRDAVNVALELGLPLLLTGEPGVGKSTLARSLNREMGYKDDELLHVTVKSDTRDSELFYSYDTLGRFHAVHGQINIADEKAKKQANEEADPRRFIRYQGLGMAILLAKGLDNIPEKIKNKQTEDIFVNYPNRRRAVVLIDEIDKAPRDMPNDILNEIERMEFRIPELFFDDPIKLETEEDKRHRPIVVITSNAERELPEAFLRRCLYYHLTMPHFKEEVDKTNSNEVTVEGIVASRFGDQFDDKQALLNEALSLFRFLREDRDHLLQRKPSLAEFLDWLRYLGNNGDATLLTKRSDFLISLQATLLKTQGDQQKIEEYIEKWKK